MASSQNALKIAGASTATTRAATPMSRSVVCLGSSRLMGQPPAADERGGVWGTGRFPTISGRRGHAGETWFPPRRTRAVGGRSSCGFPEEPLRSEGEHKREQRERDDDRVLRAAVVSRRRQI